MLLNLSLLAFMALNKMHAKFDDNKRRKRGRKGKGLVVQRNNEGRPPSTWICTAHGLLSETGLEALVCSTASLVT